MGGVVDTRPVVEDDHDNGDDESEDDDGRSEDNDGPGSSEVARMHYRHKAHVGDAHRNSLLVAVAVLLPLVAEDMRM